MIAVMLGYRFDDAIDDEDGGERDGGDEKIIGPTEKRRGWGLKCKDKRGLN